MSSPTDHDQRWMQRALELARRGVGLCSPNPAVGCVILDRDGRLAGEGWHEYDRIDHAEMAALRAAGDRARGGTAYVTLEPCNHTGRTPPCTQALIQAGVARVVAATADPNPRVAGGGMQALRAAGLGAEIGVCQAEARRINEGFARWSQSRRPLVLMKVAQSLDGRIAPPPGVPNDRSSSLGWSPGQRTARQPYWITGEAARAAVHRLRREADALLTGIGTVLADDPLLTDRSGEARRRPLLRVVLDSALRIPLDSKLVATARNDVLLFTVANDPSRIRELNERGVRVEVLPATAGHVPLGQVLDHLGGEGILTLLTETGAGLNTALLAAGLVDRLQLFVAPQIMGSDAVAAFSALSAPVSAGSLEVQRYGDDLGFSSLLRDPWLQSSYSGASGASIVFPVT